MAPDKRALEILTSMFWSSSGWKRAPSVSPEDFAYAKAQGLMFDPVEFSHDEVVDAVVNAVAGTSRKAIAHAFISSLGSRRLDLRSAMGSYAVGLHMKTHSKAVCCGNQSCAYCGAYDKANADLNVLSFERIKWGGVRHDNPRYIAFDLEAFAASESVAPKEADYLILRSVLNVAKSMPPTARLGDLERALSKLLPSNNAERRILIGILGYAGILVDPSRPDFRRQFVSSAERERTPWHKDDWPYPVQWWNGSCGVNQAAIDEWFPDL
ncbi:hypothetical protein [Labrys neptuniae]|uniref:Replication protein n=1 Tax=Labrys neptuniae TaxID=376174 RepID=A0ABV3PX88_9HYPH